jgi:hypothetical protein
MTIAPRPLCPGCGDPVGTYEPLTRVTADAVEPTSWLALEDAWRRPGETLWHAACARHAGLRAA